MALVFVLMGERSWSVGAYLVPIVYVAVFIYRYGILNGCRRAHAVAAAAFVALTGVACFVFPVPPGVFIPAAWVALDQAAPLAGWDLPEAFITLRRLLEARMGKAGKREYVQVLRLLETFRLEEVEGAVGDALRLGAIGFDAVKHLVLCRIERRPPRLNLDVYPYLPRARVAMTSAKSYMSLLSGLGA